MSKKYNKNASKLHKKVGDILYSGIWSAHKIEQEYPVYKVNPEYINKRSRFDWVVVDLKIVIECHGRQHYELSSFGGNLEDTSLYSQKSKDLKKELAAKDANFTYIVISYKEYDSLSMDLIYNKYRECLNTIEITKEAPKEDSDYFKKLKEKAKNYRKKQYLKAKESKKLYEADKNEK